MSDASRNLALERFHQETMEEAHHQMVWRDYCAARAHAEKTEDFAAGRHAQALYRQFMRLGLTDPERRVVELENEVARLAAENDQLTKMLARKRIPLPSWARAGGSPP